VISPPGKANDSASSHEIDGAGAGLRAKGLITRENRTRGHTLKGHKSPLRRRICLMLYVSPNTASTNRMPQQQPDAAVTAYSLL
jgi:hypothetical protein